MMWIESEHKEIIEKRGGHILKNRTSFLGVSVGDDFVITGLGRLSVLFFYKDKIFKKFPMAFCLNKETASTLMISTFLVKPLKVEKVIRRRKNKGLFN